MVDNKQTKKSPKSKGSKTNKQVKSKEAAKKNSSSSLVTCSIVILLLSVIITVAFPYLKDSLASFTTTTTTPTPAPVENTNSDNTANVVAPEQNDEFHPKLIITSNNNGETNYEFKCTFEINETTKELVKQFPLEMRMVDLNGQEKYHTLEKPLPVRIQPVDKVRYGDILLFQSRYLAVFYETFDPVKQYSIIGKIDDPEKLREAVGTGSITASFVVDN